MRIQSSFKDYYDWVQHAYGGGDPKIIYARRPLRALLDAQAKDEKDSQIRKSVMGDVDVFVEQWERLRPPFRLVRPGTDLEEGVVRWLAVCGKVWPMLNVGERGLEAKWEIVDVDRHQQYLRPVRFQQFDDKDREWLETIRQYVAPGQELKQVVALAKVLRSPVFTITSDGWAPDWKARDWSAPWCVTVDASCPVLGEIGLPALYPAEQLYQDLSYFLCNRMQASPDMAPRTPMTDKEKISQHGFDLKQSFRHRK